MINPHLATSLTAIIGNHCGEPIGIAGDRSLGGGCINDAWIIETTNRQEYFVKANRDAPLRMFTSEAAGLEALSGVGVIRVPQVIGVCRAGDGTCVLVLEAIRVGTRRRRFDYEFGSQLARFHRRSSQGTFGFAIDNFIGATPQPNKITEDWVAFWREYRLDFQIKLAADEGRIDATFVKLAERLGEKLPGLIGQPGEPACLLHGDLWSGNYLVDDSGEPVLIDPAVYYGRREAEFGMISLFGGFGSEFYAGYEDVWPLEAGYADRFEIYKLYHLLNHLNLFGSGYLSSCREIIRRFA